MMKTQVLVVALLAFVVFAALQEIVLASQPSCKLPKPTGDRDGADVLTVFPMSRLHTVNVFVKAARANCRKITTPSLRRACFKKIRENAKAQRTLAYTDIGMAASLTFSAESRAFATNTLGFGKKFKKAFKKIGKGLKKVGKGIGKGLKKIGKAVAKGVKAVGKFVGKLVKKLLSWVGHNIDKPTNTKLTTPILFTSNTNENCQVCQLDCTKTIGGVQMCSDCLYRYYNFGCVQHGPCPHSGIASKEQIDSAIQTCANVNRCRCDATKAGSLLKVTTAAAKVAKKEIVKAANKVAAGIKSIGSKSTGRKIAKAFSRMR